MGFKTKHRFDFDNLMAKIGVEGLGLILFTLHMKLYLKIAINQS